MVIKSCLTGFVQAEKEAMQRRLVTLERLEAATAAIDLVADEDAFIEKYKSEQDSLTMVSRSLSMLEEFVPDEADKASSSASLSRRPSLRGRDGSDEDGALFEAVRSNLHTLFYMDETNTSGVEAADEAVKSLEDLVTSQEGRDTFINGLNQFRSRKVDVGIGYERLGQVLWKTLDECSNGEHNDVRSAKIIMMLSQTFYRNELPLPPPPAANSGNSADVTTATAVRSNGVQNKGSQSDEKGGSVEHGSNCSDAVSPRSSVSSSGTGERATREYIKGMLREHRIWHHDNCRFWEQCLWQLVVDQLPTVRYNRPWYLLPTSEQLDVVARVHQVIFSQVMAIT